MHWVCMDVWMVVDCVAVCVNVCVRACLDAPARHLLIAHPHTFFRTKGLFNSHAPRPKTGYATRQFRLKAPDEKGIYPVSMGTAMHYTYRQAYEGVCGCVRVHTRVLMLVGCGSVVK